MRKEKESEVDCVEDAVQANKKRINHAFDHFNLLKQVL
jgi:hypothetical protein